jgi:peptidoglycan/xylan/chitin deacetylase (PgdA/CDA1 family)
MATPGSPAGDDRSSRRQRRAQRAAQQRRRRRLLAGGLVAIVAAAAAVSIASAGSSPSSHAGRRAGATSTPGAATTAARTTPAEATGIPGTQPVPILMYHVIAPPPASAPYPGLYVPPQEFAEQMQALAHAGWHAVTMDQVAAYWQRGVPLGPGRPIVLSFDNGYNSQFTQALPVLRSLGWVGVENIQLSGLPPSQGGLGEDQVRGLLAAGWELDTQGISHADLIALGAEQLHDQVAVARRILRARYHVPVNWFCYPSGHYDATVIAAVRAAGYRGSTTVVPGWAGPAEDRYRLHRIRVLGGTSGSALLSLIDATRSDPVAPPAYPEG